MFGRGFVNLSFHCFNIFGRQSFSSVTFLKDDRREVERQLRRQRFMVTLRCFKVACRHFVFQGCHLFKNVCLRCVCVCV